MLPLVLFMLFYKTLWLATVAWPLWASGQLEASPAAEMAHVFRGVLFIYPLLPCGYIWRTYVAGPAKKAVDQQVEVSLAGLGLASRSQLIAVAQQIIQLEEKIEGVEDKLDAVLRRLDAVGGPR